MALSITACGGDAEPSRDAETTTEATTEQKEEPKEEAQPVDDGIIDFTAEKFKIKIKLEEKHNPRLIDRIISIKNNFTREDIPLLKLYGKNELGVDETINFIESVYTKTVPLALTDDTATNINYIKNKLEEFLNLHLGKITKH